MGIDGRTHFFKLLDRLYKSTISRTVSLSLSWSSEKDWSRCIISLSMADWVFNTLLAAGAFGLNAMSKVDISNPSHTDSVRIRALCGMLIPSNHFRIVSTETGSIPSGDDKVKSLAILAALGTLPYLATKHRLNSFTNAFLSSTICRALLRPSFFTFTPILIVFIT